ncbi:baseplate J/gp47 family protein [Vibrio sp. 10N.222.49.A3]|uniref:baseplate J/gp47 family protein n=1 Tax=Vibrio sp. 10N.222.49.A3 TaxID=3229611 RepID=UPI00354F3B84
MTNRFPNIPEPQLVEVNYDADLVSLKQRYQIGTGHYPGLNDPETFHLEQIAYEKNELKALINYESKQNLLSFADKERLDNIGLLTETERLPASKARTVMAFTFTPHTGFVIAKGYQVIAVDNQTVFETLEEVVVSAGTQSINANVESIDAGLQGNGFLAGQINQAVTPLDALESVTNTETTQGGSEIEDDDDFAYRIYISPSKFSVAGPYEAYEYFARSSSSSIKNVSVWTPSPNEIEISAILQDGSLPNQAIKDLIKSECSGDKRVPMGDLVRVVDATDVTATASFHLQIFSDYASLAESIQMTAKTNIESVVNTWKTQHGRDIVPAALTSLAQRIEGVYLAKGALTDSNGQVIADTKPVTQKQRPLITLTAVTFEVITESSQQTFE